MLHRITLYSKLNMRNSYMKIFISALSILSVLFVSCDTNIHKTTDETSKSNKHYNEAQQENIWKDRPPSGGSI